MLVAQYYISLFMFIQNLKKSLYVNAVSKRELCITRVSVGVLIVVAKWRNFVPAITDHLLLITKLHHKCLY